MTQPALGVPEPSVERRTSDRARVDAIVRSLRGYRFLFGNEADLQASLTAALANRGYVVEREVRLNARDRIDMVVDRIGIEVKVDGPWSTVARQLDRYAESDALDALILVTTRARHTRMPAEMRGKPVAVVNLAGGSL